MNQWVDLPQPADPVPPRYQGVWVRTLLETAAGADTSTQVHWLQTEGWHADLRVPAGADPRTPEGRAELQGFYGLTRIQTDPDGGPDTCTWHRVWDIQPPRSTPDAGHMVFETPDRLVETGVHAAYLEVWERLPGSTGRQLAQREVDVDGDPTGRLRFVAGEFTILVQPRSTPWPKDTRPDESLTELVQRHPDCRDALLAFDIRFTAVADVPAHP